jgi:oligopeptide/dipeptide ABC transporter ATP-binding protein
MTPERSYPRESILQVGALKKHFPVKRGFFQKTAAWIKAVDGVDFELEPGKTLGLVGESGCGKSTVARMLLRLLKPDGGRILYRGQDISDLHGSQVKRLRKEVQIIFQDPFGSLNPRMTAGQAIEEGLRAVGIADRRQRRDQVEKLLALVGLTAESFDRFPHEFSGGQRQRIGIARALSVEPSLIICDEPVSALDVSIQAQILNLLRHLQETFGLSYLFISHDLNVVGYMSDMVAVMYLGHIMEYGPGEILFDHPYHPYTRALLSSVPVPGETRDIIPLGGEVPSPMDPPPGCKFQGRCPLVEPRCRQEEVAFYPMEERHLVRCWKAPTL